MGWKSVCGKKGSEKGRHMIFVVKRMFEGRFAKKSGCSGVDIKKLFNII